MYVYKLVRRNDMKKIIKKSVAVSAAALMLTSAAIQASSYSYDVSEETNKYQFNKPYLNIKMDSKADIEDVNFSLKNSDGETVATWKGNSEKFTEVAEGLYDISDADSYETADWSKLPWDKLDKESIESEYPNSILYGGRADGWYKEPYSSEYVYPSNNCFYEYIDSNYLTGEEMTVPAGTIVLDSDAAYSTNNDDYSNFFLKTYEDEEGKSTDVLPYTYFSDYAGQKAEFSVPAGEYRWWLGGWAGGVYATSYEDAQKYVQVKLNLQELLGSSTVNDNYEFIHTTGHGTFYCPTIGSKDTNAKVSFAFLSGSVVTAPIPDNDGNVYIWINANNPRLQFQDTFSIEGDSWLSFGGGTGHTVSIPTIRRSIEADFELPTDGLTLYNIPAGEYIVEADSTDYEVVNGTIQVSDTKNMQSADIEVKEVEVTSSDESSDISSDESSDVSSDESSDVSSDESSDMSSDVTESESSSDVDSVSSDSESKASFNSSSSGNKTNNSNTTNPATGAAGFAGVVMLAGAAVVMTKKKSK